VPVPAFPHVLKGAGSYDWDFFAQRVRRKVQEDITTPELIVDAVHVVNAMSKAELSGETVQQ